MTGPIDDPDPPDRALSAAEQRQQAQHRDALLGWHRYLSGARQARTLADADADGLPLRGRQRHTDAPIFGGVDGYLNPHHAWRWLRHAGPDDVPVSTLAPLALAEALTWMGGIRTGTVTPEGEPERDSPYRNRRHWYRVGVETFARLRGGSFVPPLVELSGRRPQGWSRRGRDAGRRAELSATPDRTVALVRAILAEVEPTVFAHRARIEGRPLVPRRGGRPSRAGFDNIDGRFALIPMAAIVTASADKSVVLGVPVLDHAAARHACEFTAQTYPDTFAVVSRVRDVATGGQVSSARGWLRVVLSGVDHPGWGDERFITEMRAWQQTRSGTTR